MSSCGQHRWCCQNDRNSPSCCETQSYIDFGVVTPIRIQATSDSPRSISSGGSEPPANTTSTGRDPLATSRATSQFLPTATSAPSARTDKSTLLALGIGLGLAATLFLLSAAAFFIHRVRNKNGAKSVLAGKHLHSEELPTQPVPKPPAELGQGAWELPTENGVVEMAAR